MRKRRGRARARCCYRIERRRKKEGKRRGFEERDDDENIFAFIYLYIERERERDLNNTMSSRRKSCPPKRVRFELAEIAAQHIIREREQDMKKEERGAEVDVGDIV